ncbi:MAG: hypothetical protein PUD96_03465 [Coriobacteriaceae bacterium]|nr:hypothetical protein [Coriobacteriaceae bacterium]
MADRQELRETRRRQVEQYLSSGMSVAQWCRLNKISKTTFYKWVDRFKREDPGLFAGRAAQATGDWIELSREGLRDSVALAKLSDAAPAAPCSAACAPIRVTVNGAAVEIAAGTPACDIANVLRAVAAL